jgi:cytochrome c peroxidase
MPDANIGVGIDKPEPDWGAFKTPTLRDVERNAPCMHDGSLKTLEEVVDYPIKAARRIGIWIRTSGRSI